MNKFRYKAIDKYGAYEKGVISASNQSELLAILKSNELELISCKVEGQSLITLSDNKIKLKDLISIFIHLEQLDKAGVPIIDSVSDLKDTSDSKSVQSLMQDIYESIKNGNLLSEAIEKHPETFSSVYVGLIASGEKTGNLASSFSSIVDDLKWNSEFKRKVNKASIGPLFAILMMVLIVAVMMGVVVPKVTDFLSTQGIDLPGATTSLISVSDFIKDNWASLLLSPILIFVVLKIAGRIPKFSMELDSLKLKIPLIGQILTKLDAARFCQFFAMTFKSGLGVIECLESSSMVIKNEAIKNNIAIIKSQVSEGQTLGKSIAASQYFPSLVIRMFRVGEESGDMDSALQNIKFFYDKEINDSIERLVSMIQPTLTVVMGSMILWVVIAVFGPIYGSFSNIQ